MQHKAFEFDWTGFQIGLAPLLEQSLVTRDVESLRQFVTANRRYCTSPYSGQTLPAQWETLLQSKDVQEYADFALTRYYDPSDDIGIGDDWAEALDELSPDQQQAMLGAPFGKPDARFDPGHQGAYFKTVDGVEQSLRALNGVSHPEVSKFSRYLVLVSAKGKGLYVTF